jgi:hypothetical protein
MVWKARWLPDMAPSGAPKVATKERGLTDTAMAILTVVIDKHGGFE